MILIRSPACPDCRARIPLDALYAAVATSPSGRLQGGPYGVRCPACGLVLRVHDGWVPLVAMGMVALPALLLAWFDRDRLSENAQIGALLLALPLLLLLQSRYAQRCARLLRAGDETALLMPLEPPPLRAPAGQAEVVYTQATTPWHCARCGEENPANFTTCWQCQAERSAPPPSSGTLWFN